VFGFLDFCPLVERTKKGRGLRENEQKVSRSWSGNLRRLDRKYGKSNVEKESGSRVEGRRLVVDFRRLSGYGAIVVAVSLVGFVIYELVLYPAAGFPTDDYGVIVAGANTLRVGHLLKFGYAVGLALLLVGLFAQLREKSQILAQLAAISGTSVIALLVGSGMMGLRILQVAEETFGSNPQEAITTILLRSVTIALFEAAILLSGVTVLLLSLGLLRRHVVPRMLAYIGIVLGVLFILDRVLTYPLNLVSPLLAIGWLVALSFVMISAQVVKTVTGTVEMNRVS
jgi:hypothetical protein